MTGKPLCELTQKPSEILRERVRVETVSREDPGQLIEQPGGDMLYFGGDYPHGEGFASPLEDYRAAAPSVPLDAVDRFYGGTLADVLGLERKLQAAT